MPRVIALLALLLAAVPLGSGRAAAGSPIVLTGAVFPAGFGLGVAADPVGLQAALWTPLIGFDDHLRPYAALATRIPSSADGDVRVIGGGMRVTVHLKPGLRFSDGSPLTADDVLFGLRLYLAPAIGNSFGMDEIAAASAPDPHTVVLSFNDLYGAYLAYAMPPALPHAYLMRKYRTADVATIAARYSRDPYNSPEDVFSGPYRIAQVAPGQRITLAPNPYFTALPRRGPPPELRYVVLSDDEAILAQDLHAPHSGVDIALGLSPATLPLLGGLAARGLRVRTAPSLAVEHLELNMANPALRDLRVRRALQAAIDKRGLARQVLPAALHPDRLIATSLIPSTSFYHDARLAVSAYDPALARRLLRQAGYATRLDSPGRHLTLTLVTTADVTRWREADLLAQDFARVGVRAVPRVVSGSPADQGALAAPYERGGVLATRSFDLALFDLRLGPDPATVASLFDPDRIPTPLRHGALCRNYTGIDVEALAQLPEAAQASLDPASRKLGYAKLQVKVNQLLPYIVLYEQPRILVDDERVSNLRPGPQDGGALWNAWELGRTDT